MKRLILILFCLIPYAHAAQWVTLADGIQYTELNQSLSRSWSKIHVFKIDPKRYQFQLAMAKDNGQQKTATVQEFAKQHQALLAINGGFFTRQGEPIGLRITSGKLKQPIHKTSWWGVFYIRHHKPYIVTQKAFKHRQHISFAVQSGPRLIINGEIPKLKDGQAQRTALGITGDKQVVVVVTEHQPLTTTELALLMRGMLNCQYALNLDGGSSTQLFAHIGALTLDVHGLSSVSDAVIIKARKSQR